MHDYGGLPCTKMRRNFSKVAMCASTQEDYPEGMRCP